MHECAPRVALESQKPSRLALTADTDRSGSSGCAWGRPGGLPRTRRHANGDKPPPLNTRKKFRDAIRLPGTADIAQSDAMFVETAGEVFLPGQFVDTSIPASAPADLPADLAFGDSGHANTTNSCPTYSASDGDLRDRGHGVGLMKRRRRRGLRRRCDG